MDNQIEIKIIGKNREFVFTTEEQKVCIGRSSVCDFVIPLNDLSREHCELSFSGGYAYIRDLGSKNGVMINKKRLISNEYYSLYSNSEIILAHHFKLTLSGIELSIGPLNPELSKGSIKLDLESLNKARSS